jgi:hypothetical protein
MAVQGHKTFAPTSTIKLVLHNSPESNLKGMKK